MKNVTCFLASHNNRSFLSTKPRTLLPALGSVLMLALFFAEPSGGLHATATDPEGLHKQFEQAKADAEVVAEVQAIAVVCTGVKDEDNSEASDFRRQVELQVVLQVISVEKGPLKKNDTVVVSRSVHFDVLPQNYRYQAEEHQFPFEPGAKGFVALRWDKANRAYVAVSGWVKERNFTEIPREVGKVIVAADVSKPDSDWAEKIFSNRK